MAAPHTSLSSHPSPHVLQPSTSSTTNKPLAPMPMLTPMTHIGPTKEWNIPPRPKPGRKAALDAPPTKRKAQNREAQRAFRERRAAKVGELEEQMRQMEDEGAREQEELRCHIKNLNAELERWQQISEEWRRECEKVQGMLNTERQSRQRLEVEIDTLRGTRGISTDAIPLKPRRPRKIEFAPEQQNGLRLDDKEVKLSDMTCGKCTNESRCQCIEDAFEMSNMATDTAENSNIKRPLSPQTLQHNSKRLHRDTDTDQESTEIDFTTRRPPRLPNGTSSSSLQAASAPMDSCGFCQDGTPCICATIERENEDQRRAQNALENTSNIRGTQLSSTCTNDPGTCAQCQTNPDSKAFCTTVAASRTSQSRKDGTIKPSVSTAGLTMNCATAFNTLAKHPGFSQASTQLDTWVPQLATKSVHATSTSNSSSSSEGRTAFEIEAASVMGMLKTFDRRFGQNDVLKDDGPQA